MGRSALIDLDTWCDTPEQIERGREIDEMLNRLNPRMFPRKKEKWRIALSGGPWDGHIVRVRSLAACTVATHAPDKTKSFDVYGYTGINRRMKIAFAMHEPELERRGWRPINAFGHPNFQVP